MLAEEYLYTLLGNIKIVGDIKLFVVLMIDELCLGRVLLICS